MPYTDALDRQYTATEARLWREVQHASENKGGQVRLVPLASQMPLNEQQIGQMGRTWENDGLAVTAQSGRVVLTLTDYGRRFTFEESYADIERE